MDFFSILIEVQCHKNALCVEFVVGFDQDCGDPGDVGRVGSMSCVN